MTELKWKFEKPGLKRILAWSSYRKGSRNSYHYSQSFQRQESVLQGHGTWSYFKSHKGNYQSR